MKRSARESGQALVLVLLSLSVVLTLVLYIVSRSVTDIAVTSREEEAVRAFSAAEAGVERALVAGSLGTIPGQFENATFTAEVAGVAQGERDFNYPIDLGVGDTAILWFVSHDENGDLICDATHPCFRGTSLKVCWGKVGTATSQPTTPAIEVSVFYDDGTVKIQRGAFDSYASGHSNSFSAPGTTNDSCTVESKSYRFGKTITIPNLAEGGLKFAKVRMFYNTEQNHGVGFTVGPTDTLPSQGLIISSTGTSGKSNRRLEVFQSYPEPPSVFDFALFSPGALVK